MNNRIAVIDFGTNTFHLIIYQLEEDHITEVLYKKSIPVKLKEGGWKDGRINEEAYQRAIAAVEQHRNTLNEYKVDKLIAIGTEGLRIAKNSEQFIDEVKTKFNIQIEIISGDEEATYTFYGVMKYHDIEGNVLIMDIGGGSVEFIIADKDVIYWKKSLPIGASKLKHDYQLADVISDEIHEAIKKHLAGELVEVFEMVRKYEINTLIGTSGSFETIYDILNHSKGIQFNDPWKLYDINIDSYNDLHHRFIQSTFEERLSMGGMTQFRADMMVVSSILIQTILGHLDIQNLILARTAIKEGVAFEMLND